MESIVNIESVSHFNAIKDIETKHPLVSVFDSSKSLALPNKQRYLVNTYAIFLKQSNEGHFKYGRNKYDYESGTLVFLAPGQVIEVDNKDDFQPKGWSLIFDPDLLEGSDLQSRISKYTFFSYELNEALHLSKREESIVIDLFQKISDELDQSIDKQSKHIINNTIELFLHYCKRFYDRQFITRENINNGVLSQFETLLNDYFNSNKAEALGLPSVQYFAEKLHLSSNYFGDLIKKETGCKANDLIHKKLIAVAKEKVFDLNKSVSQIAYELGFKYPQHFTRAFKKYTGVTPNAYRSLN